MTLIWDIETLAKPAGEILASLPPWSIEEAMTRLPKTHKLKPTVDAWLENDEANYGKDAIERAALDPLTGTIAVVGIMDMGFVNQLFIGAVVSTAGRRYTLESEKDIIEASLHALDVGDCFCAWNLAFDLKFLIQRAWLLGVPVPRSIYNPLARYPIPERFVCLMEKWAVNRGASYSKLQNVAKALGVPGKTGDGKDFGKLWSEDKAKALEYNRADLICTAEVARRMGCIQ